MYWVFSGWQGKNKEKQSGNHQAVWAPIRTKIEKTQSDSLDLCWVYFRHQVALDTHRRENKDH